MRTNAYPLFGSCRRTLISIARIALALGCGASLRAGPPVSDSFNSTSLNTGLWTFVNPVGDGSYQATGTHLQLNVPSGVSHDLWGANNSVRVVQPVTNGDFDIQAKFDSTVSQQYQMQGILVEQDSNNYLRFEQLTDGARVRMFSAKIVNGSPTALIDVTVTASTPVWVRVQRSGNGFTFLWSKDGSTFTSAGSFTQALTVNDVGVYGGNSGSPSPAFTASVDFFQSGTSVSTAPDLTLRKSHTGNFTQGATGTYTLTAANSGTAASSGTATVTDTVPAGLTPTSASGTGWTCGIASQTVTCTNSSAIAASASYPPITLTVSVASNAPASVTNTATVSGGGETNTSNDSASDPTTIQSLTAPVSDDFHSSSLNTSIWTFVNPLGDASYQMTGSNILLKVPAGTAHDLWIGGDNAVRIVQPATNSNFQLETKFESAVAQQYQIEGILVEQDASNYLRFDVYFDGTSPWLYSAAIVNGTPTTNISVKLPSAGAPFWIRVLRSTNNWTMSWSTNGTTFNTAGTFSQTLTANRVGPYAGNNAPSPAFVGSVDYFFNSASPISPEDGGGIGISLLSVTPTANSATVAWSTDRTSSSQVNYGATSSYGSSTTLDSTLVTQHFQTISGLTCGTTYHYSVVSKDSTGSSINSPDSTFVPSCSVGGPISDDFQSTTLNTNIWTFVNPQNDGSYSLNGSGILLTVPAGINHDVWTTGDMGVRVMQPISNADFEVEVKFNSAPGIQSPYQEQGIIVEQDASTFLRFSEYSDNLRTILFVANISGGTGTVLVNQEIRGGAALYLRVKRTGSNWLFSYSYDMIHWTPGFAFTQAIQVAKIGPYAGNAQFNGGAAPAFTAIVDYFVNRVSPPSTLNGNPYPPVPAPPAINVWYGDTQSFGQNGIPQQWVNILGDVSDFYQVATLIYTLNGGAAQTLWMGENDVRLVAPGNFNVEIDYASLNAGANTLQITATDALGARTTHTVTINYAAGHVWPSNYSVDWSTAGNIQSVAQVVDGRWQIQSNGTARILETGYDRLIAIGDRGTWQNYVATAEVTLNSLDPFGFGVGIICGWQGHTTLQYGQPLPDQPRTGHPFPGFGGYIAGGAFPGGGPPSLNIYTNTPSTPEAVLAQTPRTLQLGVKYIFKFQVQQNLSGGSHYSFKAWPASSPEPAPWDVQADGELSQGSILLAAHRADVSFGLVTVTGL
jgi:uncharacterized repeat protein (TIGR01451 family)